MSWKHKNAVTRTFNAFKRNKDRIYSEDVESLKLLSELVESGHEKVVSDNVLFSKLLCFCLNRMTLHYGDVKLAIKECDYELSKSLDVHLKELQYSLNKLEELKSSEKIKNASDLTNINTEKWTYNSVYSSFIATCNDFIKDIKNYV